MAARWKRIIVRTLLILIALPVAAVLLITGTIGVLNRTNGTLVSSGRKRDYLLHVPRGYDPARPTPLVICLHGAGGWPAQQRNLTRWDRLADAQGFLVVYPSGQGTPRIWNIDDPEDRQREVRFISDLIDRLEAAYAIDPARIYVNGFSNGGGMAFVLSCALPGRIAAVGTVSPAQSLPWNTFADPAPMPLISFHGTADPIIPYQGGPLGDPFNPVKVDFPPVCAWTAQWAQRNRCGADPVESPVAAHVTRLDYGGCASGAPVVLYTVQGGGHTWPGGKPLPEWWLGATNHEIDATALMWAFFQAHPLARKQEP